MDRIAEQATEVDGVRLVAVLEDANPEELRELAQKVVGKLEGNGERPSCWARPTGGRR